MGPVNVSAAYYYCQHCKHGHKPREKILRLNAIALPPAAEELVALAGALESFAYGADRVLQKMAGLRLSESTVERTTEAAGQRIREWLDQGTSLRPTGDWTW